MRYRPPRMHRAVTVCAVSIGWDATTRVQHIGVVADGCWITCVYGGEELLFCGFVVFGVVEFDATLRVRRCGGGGEK